MLTVQQPQQFEMPKRKGNKAFGKLIKRQGGGSGGPGGVRMGFPAWASRVYV